MGYIIIGLLIIIIVLLIICISKSGGKDIDVQQIERDLNSGLSDNIKNFGELISKNQTLELKNIGDKLTDFDNNTKSSLNTFDNNTKSVMEMLDKNINSKINILNETINDKQNATQKYIETFINQQEERFNTFSTDNKQSLEAIRSGVAKSLKDIQDDNNKKLDEMRGIVDEKLQKTLEERMTQSFSLVNERLEQVYKGLGEMQTLAAGVGDLKKVLSNVKTRGIVGEIQLGAILQEILSPEQYEENVAVVKNSRDRVEFAIKMPGKDNNSIYLPIDSKFPGNTYQNLLEAYDSGVKENVDAAAKQLIATIKNEAKDISTKYISPPDTTEFAIMFLPFEGLYAEVVNRGMVEELQRLYKVNVAGPSTMAALLNSLQMGFKTLAIQKRTSEVWKVLSAVKTEFDKFNEVLEKAQGHINSVNKDLDMLIGTRSRMISSKLNKISTLESDEQADEILKE